MTQHPLSDKQYGQVLDNIVVGCVDVAVVSRGQILLERRNHDPIKDEWWIFGGRILIGETLQAAAQRGVAQELNLHIPQPERFIELGAYNLRWPLRREKPVKHGCHHLLIAHMVELTEVERVGLDETLSQREPRTAWHKLTPKKSFLPELASIVERAALQSAVAAQQAA